MTAPMDFSDEARWNRHKSKYNTNNPLSRMMIRGFYKALEKIITQLEDVETVLEVGCGSGDSSMRIYNMLSGQKMEVSDVTEIFVERLKQSDFPLPVTQESVLNLQRDDNSIDVVILLEVLEHLEDYHKALSELFRVANKYVILSVPNEPLWRALNMARGKYWSQLGNTPTHINHWSMWGINRLISQYGQIIKTSYPIPWTIVMATSSDQNP